MATNDVLVKNGTLLSFQSASYVPTGNNDLTDATPTTIVLNLSSITAGAAINSDQIDLGAARAGEYSLSAALEFFAAIIANSKVSFYWSYSQHSSAGIGNMGRTDGVAGAYTGDGGGDVEESVKQMQLIGVFITTDLVGVQIADVGSFVPKGRYGQLVIVNNTATTICATDDIESAVLMSPEITEIQAAA